MRLTLDKALQLLKLDAGDKSAKWQKLFPLCTVFRRDMPGGKLVIDRPFLAAMKRNWDAAGGPSLPVDYFHRGDSENDGLPTDQKVAAGWIEQVELRDDGLYGLVSWNERARNHILADELRFLSPSFAISKLGQATGDDQGPTLFGAALLNDPFLTQLPRVAASASKELTVNFLQKLCAALNIAEGSDEDTVMTALTARLSMSGDDDKKKLAATTKALTDIGEENKKLAAAVEAKEKRLAVIEGERKAEKLVQLGDKLFRTGRKFEAARIEQAVTAFGLDEGEKFLMALPATVKLGEVGITGESDPDKDPSQANAKFQAHVDTNIKAGLGLNAATMKAKKDHPNLWALANSTIASDPAAQA